MATTANGTPYVESSDLVANYPAVSLALAEHIDDLPSGLSLVTPTSIANSGGTATATNGQVTFAGVTAISVNGIFTSAHQNYLLVGSYVGSANIAVRARYRVGGADNTTANSYITQALVGSGTSVSASRSTADFRRLVEANTTLANFSWRICSPNTATNTADFLDYSTEIVTCQVGIDAGGHNSSTIFDGFTIYPTAGNITGTVRVYGYQNS